MTAATSSVNVRTEAPLEMPESGYDKIAHEYYDPKHVTSRNFDHATVQGLKTHPFALSPDGLVLEIGAGRGRAGEFLGLDGTRVVQLDNSEAMLSLQSREACLVRVLADACKIPLAAQQFAAVVGFLADPFLGLACLAEAHRMLRPGGGLLLTTPTYAWGKTLREGLGLDVMTTRFKQIGTETVLVLPSLLHSTDILRGMLVRIGFRDIEIYDHYLPPGEDPISPDIATVCSGDGIVPGELPIIHSIRAKR
jgi:SAM-dependent methyltransferase